MDFFRDKLVLRPSEISNNPEVVRRVQVDFDCGIDRDNTETAYYFRVV